MGDLKCELDGDWASYCEEPGFHHRFRGDQLAQLYARDPQRGTIAGLEFYNPPGSQWLLAQPRQFRPDWYQDSRLSQHVLRKSRWQFANGVTVEEKEFISRRPSGTSYPDNQWMSVAVPGTGVFSLDSTNYHNLGNAMGGGVNAGINLLQVVTLGFCLTTPNGLALGSGEYEPCAQWQVYPQPDDVFVFGWGNLALVYYHDTLHLLRTPNRDKQTWEMLGHWPLQAGGGDARFDRTRWANPFGAPGVTANDALIHGVIILQVGPDSISVHPDQLPPQQVRLRKPSDPGVKPPLFGPGPWWVGASLGTRFSFQAQVVGHESVSTDAIPNPSRPPAFGLGETYKPTVEPEWVPALLVHGDDPVSQSTGPNGTTYTSTFGDAVTVQVRDETGVAWVSDGTHHQGQLYLKLEPANIAAGGFLAPQVMFLDLRFPTKLSPRVSSPLVLNDGQFLWKAETSLREADGKRVGLTIWESGLELLTANNFDRRTRYPVRIYQETGGEQIDRARGWVMFPDLVEHVADAGDRKNVRAWALQGRGVISRLDTEWNHVPQMLKTGEADDDGQVYLDHAYAVKETVQQSGIDPADADQMFVFADPFKGTAVARLPLAGLDAETEDGQESDSHWAPDLTETRLQYATRTATQWRGWHLYENLLGVLQYHPMLDLEMSLGQPYFVSVKLWASEAAARNALSPGQTYLSLGRRTLTPQVANQVQVYGKGLDGKPIRVIDRDLKSITDPTSERFIGEPLCKNLPLKLAVDEGSARQLARVAGLQLRRQQAVWVVETMLAPWQMKLESGVTKQPDSGYVAWVEGQGDHLICGMEVEQVWQDLYKARLSLWKVPGESSAGTGEEAYPGRPKAS